MTDIVLEIIRAIVLLGIVLFLWNAGHKRFDQTRKGWNFIILGFGLLLFATFLDISDNFENLNRFIVIGDTETEAFLEKFVGYLGGFIFLAIGLFKWIPGVQGLSDLVDARTRDIQEVNVKLVSEIAERKLAEKVKQEFISTVSHELRTPLTSIKGSLRLIQSGKLGKLSDQMQSMLDISCNNSERLILLINDILDVEKIEAGKMSFNLKPTNISLLIKEALQANKGYGEEFGVTFICSNCDEDITANGDVDRLMQVMSNLMSNAAKFSPDGGQVELSATSHGQKNDQKICIAVKDYGPGIPQDFRDNIFNKFTQADASDSRQRGGTGLGLSITKSIVEHHGGTIGFESEVGKGSTFFIEIPKLAR